MRCAEHNQLANDAVASTAAQSGKLQGVRFAHEIAQSHILQQMYRGSGHGSATTWYHP